MEVTKVQMLSKREQKKQINRQNIINAAIHLFSSKPFSEVSMRAIAKHANVSPGLIYQYFDDQQHLFMTAFKIESTGLLNALQQTIQIQENQLSLFAKEYVDYMYTHDNLYQMMTYFMLENEQHHSVSNGLREITDDLFALFRTALSHHLPEDDLKNAAQLLFAALNGILISYKNLPGRSNEASRSHIDHLVDVLIETVKRQVK